MRDAACEPELPPLDIIKGTNKERTIAFSISPSKYPIADAVSISPKNRTISQVALFLTKWRMGVFV